MSRPWHPSMGDAPREFRVCCDDGSLLILADDLTYDEAVDVAQDCDMDTDSHAECISHIVEMYAGWVPISTSRAVA